MENIVQANASCADKSYWYVLTHPGECWPFGGLAPLPAPISATLPNVPVVAPATLPAMTIPGVWTPDYAIQRTNSEVTFENEMRKAAIEAATRTGRYAGGIGLPFQDPNAPDPSDHSSLWLLAGAAAAVLLILIRK